LRIPPRLLCLAVAAAWLPGVAAAQPALPRSNAAVTNPVRGRAYPLDLGVLAQGGLGITENRGSFRFFMAGLHAGKVLSANHGPGVLRGDFEYAVELFPFWQSYTPVQPRQNCFPIVPGSTTVRCSGAFNVGGTFTGVSVTPIILRWNFTGTRRISPWVQGAGGLLWTNHKYPAFGGPPAFSPGSVVTNPGNSISFNSSNADTSVWNFTPQFGIGVHYFIGRDRSIDLGANAIHISSASLGDRNPGVNASAQFTLGYSWWK
jgi:lipid A 3-O-deacylase